MSRKSLSRTAPGGFTILELLVVVAIIAMLATLLLPVAQQVIAQTDKVKCTHNLKQLGIVIQSASLDNNGTYPNIENDSQNPIHTEADGKVWTLAELVQSRQAPLDILKCPADIHAKLAHPKSSKGATSYFESKGASYEWFPFFEGESLNTPRIFSPFGVRTVPLSRVRLLMDYAESGEAPHERTSEASSMHVFYADGSVRSVLLSKAQ